REWVEKVLSAVPVDVLQFHGSESAAQCTGFGRPYIKAIGMQPGLDVQPVMQSHPEACGFLLDAWQPDTHGGGGIAFDWAEVPANTGRPLILAGGLTPESVGEAIIWTRPFAVDVSSGVELEKGIKSIEKMQAFVRGVESGDASKANR
ncbi:MAG: N-(5'-phosphoribosyl)anthranilate isomerase, partial [Thermotogales bacterium]|nr:N-(5'-phosphoribosyl)anthranilate isomerase [Thermotogales bacterium]